MIRRLVQRLLKIESPSKLYAQIGAEQAEEFRRGLDDPNGWDKLSVEDKIKFFERCRASARTLYLGDDT